MKMMRDGRNQALAAIVVSLLTYSVMLASSETIQLFAGREMILENLGALCFLLSSILFFSCWAAARRQTGGSAWRRWIFLALGGLFFVAAGEELSWGQHWLGFETPGALKELNAQQEVNLHNLWWLDSYQDEGQKKEGWRALVNSNRLFDYFMISVFWLAPFGHRFLAWARRLLGYFGAPIFPLWLAAALLLNYLLSLVAELLLVEGPLEHLAVSEIRECNYAFLGLVAAWWLRRIGLDRDLS